MPDLSLVHLVRKPLEPSSGAPPLLLLLHGLGSDEADLYGLARYLDPRFFIVSARAPIPWQPGFAWFELYFTPEGEIYANMARAVESYQQLQGFLQEVVTAYEVDPAQVYLMGFSQGAMMSLLATLVQPEGVKGLVVMSGRLPKEAEPWIAEPERLAGIPILAVHGIQDEVLPIENGRQIRDYLQALPVDFTYQEYPMGHQVSAESLRDITQWLTRQLNSGS